MGNLTVSYTVDGAPVEAGEPAAYEGAGEAFKAATAALDQFPLGLIPEECQDVHRKILGSLQELRSYCLMVVEGAGRYHGNLPVATEEARPALQRAERLLRRRKSLC